MTNHPISIEVTDVGVSESGKKPGWVHLQLLTTGDQSEFSSQCSIILLSVLNTFMILMKQVLDKKNKKKINN